ncbi:aminotransferase class I/II-fold pyridoxal phosphate-dependent enzyme [Weissella paramesenteroides]|uniref:aminotransferase class I/II-fold pyridoxal phosphate-dependent enzyme n=1 Tax=Weissella paramesenteroides TaxID=1249 RepID=UPI0021AFFB73|nr:aminotransferase class I/II-fold pyridoxal phosphate-dependent enzyme [Weissella paramesenteroides]MCS9984000.1 aminotransferase class I/II-fold pyridoxal phosphate-dependent enzyme [Weissella paramesenteroides]MCS9998470.1 aminotransferase class I/II-fold pyridoxal phosphate-dependent enzyme [Weissella paramesenteroides]MCT0259458.1 aminotransferase class I/II-fold pyridoxal phosphate-dependent enzyme [Weissella paramesenteroides]
MVELSAALAGQHNNILAKMVPSPIRVVDDKFSTIDGILKLTLGEPDFAAPEHIKQAIIRDVQADDSHYSSSQGVLALREAISDYLVDRFDTPRYDPATEVSVTVGAAEAISATFQALFNPGDELIVPTPTFPLYASVAQTLGIEVIGLNTAPDFIVTPAKLMAILTAHPNAKAILLNYPSNPTGVTYSETELKALVAILREHQLLVIADEIYAELVYDAKHTSMARLLPEQTVLISGVSKSHAMTGYRIGYVVGPAELMKQVGKAHQAMVATAPGPMMAGALEALRNGREDPEKMRVVYEERRDLVLAGLAEAGFTAAQPGGAFYIFAKIPDFLNTNDTEFVYDLADTVKLGVAPGSIFGAGGEGYIRISYAASTENLKSAITRLKHYVDLRK